jgi:protease I
METKERIACIIANDFEDSEFTVPYQHLKAAGFEVELIGDRAESKVKGKRGKAVATIEKGIDDAVVSDYVALLIPGGHSPDQLRADDRFVSFIREFAEAHKLIAAVCHGPQLLLTAGLVRDRTLTAWDTIQSDLAQVGAHVKDEEVVVDDNWITSRKPGDLEAFTTRLIEALELEHEERQESSQRMISEGSPTHHV